MIIAFSREHIGIPLLIQCNTSAMATVQTLRCGLLRDKNCGFDFFFSVQEITLLRATLLGTTSPSLRILSLQLIGTSLTIASQSETFMPSDSKESDEMNIKFESRFLPHLTKVIFSITNIFLSLERMSMHRIEP